MAVFTKKRQHGFHISSLSKVSRVVEEVRSKQKSLQQQHQQQQHQQQQHQQAFVSFCLSIASSLSSSSPSIRKSRRHQRTYPYPRSAGFPTSCSVSCASDLDLVRVTAQTPRVTGSPISETQEGQAGVMKEDANARETKKARAPRSEEKRRKLPALRTRQSSNVIPRQSFKSVQYAVKFGLMAIIVACFLYAGKEIAVAVVVMSHVMVAQRSKVCFIQKIRYTRQGTECQKLTFSRSSSVPLQIPFETQQSPPRSRSFPETQNEMSLIRASESSQSRNRCRSCIRLQIMVICALCGLLHGHVTAICISLICALMLVEMQKWHSRSQHEVL